MKTLALLALEVLLLIDQPNVVWGAWADTVMIPSAAMGRSIPALVVVPGDRGDSGRAYPVVYVLHGFGGSFRSVGRLIDVGAAADMYGCVIVCPDGSRNSWYLDSPVDTTSRFETHVAREVPEWVELRYPIRGERAYRAITGSSMGGHGALYIALRHPETFGAAGSMSGVLDLAGTTQPVELTRKLGEISLYPERWREHSVVTLIDSLRPGLLAIAIDCGVDDPFIAVNRLVNARLLAAGVAHDYYERPGGHNGAVFARQLEFQLHFFAQHFRASGTKPG